MGEPKKIVVYADGYQITVRRSVGEPDFISLTDFAKRDNEEPNVVVQNWMRNRQTIEFLALWERLNNPVFNEQEVQKFWVQAGSNSFTMSPKKWIESTGAIGIESKAGRYGGTFAHEDIALEFMSWLNSKFKLYFMMEYKRLKVDDSIRRFSADTNNLSYLPGSNESIFTDLPPAILWDESYARLSEEDVVNVAMFGMTQAQFMRKYPDARGDMRSYSSLNHIVSFLTLASKNRELAVAGVGIKERLLTLNEAAIALIASDTRYLNKAAQLPQPEGKTVSEEAKEGAEQQGAQRD